MKTIIPTYKMISALMMQVDCCCCCCNQLRAM